jgi:hypothetical protein
MATTQTIPIAQRQIGPAGFTSQGAAIPANLETLNAQLASSDWTNAAFASATLTWRIERSKDGVSWDEAVGNAMKVGSWTKGVVGNMPSIGCSPSLLAGYSQLRLFISCTTTISLGGTITVVTNP